MTARPSGVAAHQPTEVTTPHSYTMAELQLAMGITPVTQTLLRELNGHLPAVLPGILDDFYAMVQQQPALRTVVKDPQMIPRLKEAQTAHWLSLFNAHFDEPYQQQVLAVAKAHLRIQLQPEWYLCAYQFVLHRLMHYVYQAPAFRKRQLPMLAAVQQAVFMDIVSVMQVYNDQLRHANKTSLIEQLENIPQSAHQIQQAMQEATNHMNGVAEATDAFSEGVATLSEQAGQTNKLSNQARQQSSRSQQAMTQLNDNAGHIDAIVGLIEQVASQTNLLALNATIEASRVGEHGKGFQVVANEVKALANRTSGFSKDIRQQVGGIRQEMETADQGMQSVGQLVDNVTEHSHALAHNLNEQTGAIHDINQSLNRLRQKIDQVGHAVDQLNQTSETLLHWARQQ